MNTTVAAALAEELAGLSAQADVPVEPFGYGIDLSCVTDVTADLAEVDPTSPVAIVEALIRRLITPRGALLDDKDYGFNLRGYCNRGITPAELQTLNGQVRSECRKDDRVEDVTAAVSSSVDTKTLRVSITVTPVDVNLGTFSFTFAVSDTKALLETITG